MQAVDALNTRDLRARASPRAEGLALPPPPRVDFGQPFCTPKDSFLKLDKRLDVSTIA